MVYIILVYDISVKRVNKVHKYLKQYLYWRQNSVFEGELSASGFSMLKAGLLDIIEVDEDMVIFYTVKSESYMKTEILGTEKEKRGFII